MLKRAQRQFPIILWSKATLLTFVVSITHQREKGGGVESWILMHFLLHYAWGVVFHNENVLLRQWIFPMECWGALNKGGEHRKLSGRFLRRLQPAQAVSVRGPLKPNGLGVCLSARWETIKEQVCGTHEARRLAFRLSGWWETFEAKDRGLNPFE